MKTSKQYKLLVTFILVFVAAISLSIGFLVGTNKTSGNVAYWIFKIITILWLVIECVALWLPKVNIGNQLVVGCLGFIAQLVPIFLRIGYSANDKTSTPIAWIYISAILLFILIAIALFLSISGRQFKEAENRAKNSSNQ